MCASTGALLIAGGIAQGVAGFAGAQAQASTLKYQASVNESNANLADIKAEDEKDRGATEAAQLRNQASKLLAAQVSATAGAGIDIGGATAQEVFLSTELIGSADVLESMRNTKKKVWAFEFEAASKRAQARSQKKAAKTTALLAPISAIAPIVGGFGASRVAEKRGV